MAWAPHHLRAPDSLPRAVLAHRTILRNPIVGIHVPRQAIQQVVPVLQRLVAQIDMLPQQFAQFLESFFWFVEKFRVRVIVMCQVQERILLHFHEILVDQEFIDPLLANATNGVFPQNIKEFFLDQQSTILVDRIVQQTLVQEPNVQGQNGVSGTKFAGNSGGSEPTSMISC